MVKKPVGVKSKVAAMMHAPTPAPRPAPKSPVPTKAATATNTSSKKAGTLTHEHEGRPPLPVFTPPSAHFSTPAGSRKRLPDTVQPQHAPAAAAGEAAAPTLRHVLPRIMGTAVKPKDALFSVLSDGSVSAEPVSESWGLAGPSTLENAGQVTPVRSAMVAASSQPQQTPLALQHSNGLDDVNDMDGASPLPAGPARNRSDTMLTPNAQESKSPVSPRSTPRRVASASAPHTVTPSTSQPAAALRTDSNPPTDRVSGKKSGRSPASTRQSGKRSRHSEHDTVATTTTTTVDDTIHEDSAPVTVDQPQGLCPSASIPPPSNEEDSDVKAPSCEEASGSHSKRSLSKRASTAKTVDASPSQGRTSKRLDNSPAVEEELPSRSSSAIDPLPSPRSIVPAVEVDDVAHEEDDLEEEHRRSTSSAAAMVGSPSLDSSTTAPTAAVNNSHDVVSPLHTRSADQAPTAASSTPTQAACRTPARPSPATEASASPAAAPSPSPTSHPVPPPPSPSISVSLDFATVASLPFTLHATASPPVVETCVEGCGLCVGDVILAIAGSRPRSARDARDKLARMLSARRVIALEVRRDPHGADTLLAAAAADRERTCANAAAGGASQGASGQCSSTADVWALLSPREQACLRADVADSPSAAWSAVVRQHPLPRLTVWDEEAWPYGPDEGCGAAFHAAMARAVLGRLMVRGGGATDGSGTGNGLPPSAAALCGIGPAATHRARKVFTDCAAALEAIGVTGGEQAAATPPHVAAKPAGTKRPRDAAATSAAESLLSHPPRYANAAQRVSASSRAAAPHAVDASACDRWHAILTGEADAPPPPAHDNAAVITAARATIAKIKGFQQRYCEMLDQCAPEPAPATPAPAPAPTQTTPAAYTPLVIGSYRQPQAHAPHGGGGPAASVASHYGYNPHFPHSPTAVQPCPAYPHQQAYGGPHVAAPAGQYAHPAQRQQGYPQQQQHQQNRRRGAPQPFIPTNTTAYGRYVKPSG